MNSINPDRPLYTQYMVDKNGIYEVVSATQDGTLTVQDIKTKEALVFPHDKLLPLQTFIMYTKSVPEAGSKDHEIFRYEEGRIMKYRVNNIVAVKWLARDIVMIFSESLPSSAYICQLVDREI